MREEDERKIFQAAFAIGYAENECVQTVFPANNPVPGVTELTINNPMTPHSKFSFWFTTMRPYCQPTISPNAERLVRAVDEVFAEWGRVFQGRTEVPLSRKPYLLDDRGIDLGAGIVQIRAYATETNSKALRESLGEAQRLLKLAKTEFFEEVRATDGLNYFGSLKKGIASVHPESGDSAAQKA